MKTNQVNTFLLLSTMIILSASLTKAQDSTKSTHQHNMMMDSTKDMNMHDMEIKDMKMKGMKSMKAKDSIVREGVIDLTAIDENKDGKVFQDTMDWNVISDKAGECPLCGMNLKEVSLEKAKANLIKHDFKVK